MMSLKETIAWAKEKKVAIGHFNVSDSEGFRAVVEGAKELGVPVIIGVSEGEREFIGVQEVASLVKIAKENGHPIFLNADHTYSVDKAKVAIDAGFDAVIIDGANKSYEENVAMTKEVVAYAKAQSREVLVEAELGFIGQSSKIIDTVPDGVSEETQTKPEEAARFVMETGVDLFAPSVGNVHGLVKSGQPKLNIERIKAISEAVNIPLVLHGGSGIADPDFVSAIEAGIRIIHINTELRVAYKEGVEEGLKSGELAPYKFMQEAVKEMEQVVKERLKLFNRM
ncbi:class II fructose-bisphosphate aldolase [Candidatus Parcubacteria bacterium]|nr:class II fructose-bisphosphate aldolase [Candidatus Parcubacteria bacterium]